LQVGCQFSPKSLQPASRICEIPVGGTLDLDFLANYFLADGGRSAIWADFAGAAGDEDGDIVD
jgi:hypothetical protein